VHPGAARGGHGKVHGPDERAVRADVQVKLPVLRQARRGGHRDPERLAAERHLGAQAHLDAIPPDPRPGLTCPHRAVDGQLAHVPAPNVRHWLSCRAEDLSGRSDTAQRPARATWYPWQDPVVESGLPSKCLAVQQKAVTDGTSAATVYVYLVQLGMMKGREISGLVECRDAFACHGNFNRRDYAEIMAFAEHPVPYGRPFPPLSPDLPR
jgi:hypothetical protein